MEQWWMENLLEDPESILISLRGVLDNFHEGVIIADHEGRLIYMNAAQAKIDGLNQEDIIGRKATEIYRVDDGASPLMHCIRTGRKIDNLACYYRTHQGKIINSIHNIFPILRSYHVSGCICFIREYSSMGASVEKASLVDSMRPMRTFGPPDRSNQPKSLGNGTRFIFDDIIGDDSEFLKAVNAARMACDTPSPIMLYGETGTGKELFAQSVHNCSSRRRGNYVAVNCAAIPENLLEGILFGTTRGAFTGALDKEGLFEKADGGTILLDEVNSMPVGLQAKLLRVIQEKRVRRIGSLKEVDIDVKIISSTNESPQVACYQGRFRNDLLYRLGVVFIRIPPLRQRKDDLEKLISHFLHRFNGYLGKRINTISSQVIDFLYSYHWPGNVRELEHMIEGAMNMAGEDDIITMDHLAVHIGNLKQFSFSRNFHHTDEAFSIKKLTEEASAGNGDRTSADSAISSDGRSLAQLKLENEKSSIIEALKKSRGNVARAARSLGTSPQLIHYKIKRYGIDRLEFR